MARQETKADLERRLKALNSLKNSTREMIERYSLFFKNAHDENCPSDCKTEYYYQCRLCRAKFWNYSPPVGRQIPKWYKEQVHD